MMGTRAGSIDPGIVFRLIRDGRPARDDRGRPRPPSGLLGVAGTARHGRPARAPRGRRPASSLAIDLFVRRAAAGDRGHGDQPPAGRRRRVHRRHRGARVPDPSGGLRPPRGAGSRWARGARGRCVDAGCDSSAPGPGTAVLRIRRPRGRRDRPGRQEAPQAPDQATRMSAMVVASSRAPRLGALDLTRLERAGRPGDDEPTAARDRRVAGPAEPRFDRTRGAARGTSVTSASNAAPRPRPSRRPASHSASPTGQVRRRAFGALVGEALERPLGSADGRPSPGRRRHRRGLCSRPWPRRTLSVVSAVASGPRGCLAIARAMASVFPQCDL